MIFQKAVPEELQQQLLFRKNNIQQQQQHGGAAAAGRRRRPVVVAGKAGKTGPGQTKPRQGTTSKPAKPRQAFWLAGQGFWLKPLAKVSGKWGPFLRPTLKKPKENQGFWLKPVKNLRNVMVLGP